MIAVVQRVEKAKVEVEGKEISKIDRGLLVFIGIDKDDSDFDIEFIAKKIINLRIFEDNEGKFNLSIKDIKGKILSISQFTLLGDVRKGNRPSFNNAMPINLAKNFYKKFFNYLKSLYNEVYDGVFQAKMKISLLNDGPVTIIIDSKVKRK